MQITEARFFLIAVGLHAALPVMAFVAPSPAAEEAPRPIEGAIEIEVEPTKESPEVSPLPAAQIDTPPRIDDRPPPIDPSRAERPLTSVMVPGPAPTGILTAEPTATGAPTIVVAPKSEYDGPPPAVPGGPVSNLPGIGSPVWAIPGVVPDMGTAAPAATAAPKATVDTQIATKVLTQVIKEKDKSLGLDLPGAGTIASTVRSVVASSSVPTESRATVEVRLSPTGQVLSARVTSSSGGGDAWSGVAKSVQASLAGKALLGKSGFEKGAIVYVSVTSTATLPDGTKSSIERDGAGAKFDLANIGAHMQRVVKTSYSVAAVK